RTARDWFERYGFREIRTPLLESTALFERSVGEQTDIVHKEMYTFERGDDRVSLRPESTASVVRAFVEASRAHELSAGYPERLYYLGPMFRYERPQRGRQRQFHQIGAEVLGSPDPQCDVEALAMLWHFLEAVGVERKALVLNSVGDRACRPTYRQVLVDWLAPRVDGFCEDCKRRYRDNPLRVLDCKLDQDRAQLAEAPRLADHLCEPCETHFAAVRAGLDAFGVPYTVDANIVRGLDYYVRTVFEVLGEDLGAQNAILGGGRYDGLVEELGGPDVPGFGFAIGTERLLICADRERATDPAPAVALIGLGAEGFRRASEFAERFRKAGLSVLVPLVERPMGAQMKRADRLGVRRAMFVGEREIEAGRFGVKDLRTGDQSDVELDDLVRVLGEP
ncbi:MAG: histidine--tRNA ligase, partial [Planctomycetota bacterium]|nr:histidine--tRNA ligase [Planctomycetota bacterium]